MLRFSDIASGTCESSRHNMDFLDNRAMGRSPRSGPLTLPYRGNEGAHGVHEVTRKEQMAHETVVPAA